MKAIYDKYGEDGLKEGGEKLLMPASYIVVYLYIKHFSLGILL